MRESRLQATYLDPEMRKSFPSFSAVCTHSQGRISSFILFRKHITVSLRSSHRKVRNLIPLFQDNNLIPKSVEVKHQNISIVVRNSAPSTLFPLADNSLL